ncbi:tRNA (adenosine(37)-N6)-threonylcarbamoyltransferase complex transferase subunit TsaD [Patescibacteria group bacterium]|nr:tRNA (adenosine(37)-N6)-threonylcarbamoyltransferase complex transferase subunit TsaD [Patescibacteria group bacterium]MBU1967470.1 tRNA (adenosine(37)-N6)-threonylcarbamoyltransferase complex transferase subunit TsaD [Patescibacteria group bacterium]
MNIQNLIIRCHQLPLILAIDTSCDDTSAAVTSGITVLSNIIASQSQLHTPYGGVFPTVAKQAHQENIDQTIKLALKRAGAASFGAGTASSGARIASFGAEVGWEQIQAIAVTQGPGLAPALEVGIAKAKQLALKHNLPLIAVNHIEAHALSPLAKAKQRTSKPITPSHHFPALAIVVSGGHTEFIKVSQIGEYQRLGATIDDAAGEVLDKVGRMLNLGYPAGPIIEKFAQNGDRKKHLIPLPMTDREDFNMSFSGLKTWARNKLEELETQNSLDRQGVYDFTASFQYGVFRHICYKLNKLLKKHQVVEVWLGGGVAANIQLRRMIRETLTTHSHKLLLPKIKLFTPYTKRLCMDNAAMIGITASFQFQQQKFVKNINDLERKPRWEVSSWKIGKCLEN